ncbi:hypothetical protein SETIT_4G099400v2 [Setaria italica]|uniref:Uncharacterized protein n=1 Tax=Setaria italica TaxID=4555 RepID=A0A368QSL0_SETIT|nr:hypothetical protein SETIT_4G099400v2 [Setaria italica]
MDGSNATASAVSVVIRGGSPRGRSAPRAPAASPPPPPGAGRRRRAVARGVQSTLARTSLLANFVPTGTLLAFEVVLPAASGRDAGSCSAASAAMLRALLALCAASCFLLHFTDSFGAPDGKVYYGVVTPRGLSLLRTGLGVEVPRDDRYRLAFVDVVHAFMSVLVFAAVALADNRVSRCLLPGHRKEMARGDGEVPARGGGRVQWPLLGVPQHPLRHRLLGCLKTAEATDQSTRLPDQSMAV